MSKVVTLLSVFTLLFVVTACGDESSSSGDAAVAACQSRCAKVAALGLNCENDPSNDLCLQSCATYGMVMLPELSRGPRSTLHMRGQSDRLVVPGLGVFVAKRQHSM